MPCIFIRHGEYLVMPFSDFMDSDKELSTIMALTKLILALTPSQWYNHLCCPHQQHTGTARHILGAYADTKATTGIDANPVLRVPNTSAPLLEDRPSDK